MNKKSTKKSRQSSRKSQKSPLLSKLAFILISAVALILIFVSLGAQKADIIVHTNAFFAPFEYYNGSTIEGVDVDIMNAVAKSLGKTVSFTNVEFSAIIDNVAEGKVCDAGAAGITITESRAAKVDFSIPYYTSVQYVIYDQSAAPAISGNHIVWESLAGKTIGVQTDTTGWIYADEEISAGVLSGTNTTLKNFDAAQLAADGIASGIVNYVIVDELPAQYIVAKNSRLAALPLYYSGTDGDAPVEESYAIAVTKGNTELLTAINTTLESMLVKDANGQSTIDKLVLKHMGL